MGKAGLYDAHMHSCHDAGFSPLPGRRLLSCAAGPDDWLPLLSESRREIRIFLGLHPMNLPGNPAELPPLLERLSDHLRAAPRAGVGECGLDRRDYKAHPRLLQEEALRFQIRLAVSLDRPLNLHQVRAAGALAEVLEDERPRVPLIIHGFREKRETAERLLRTGAYLSFGPGRHWEDEGFRSLFRAIPRERILMESDWPYADGPAPIPESEFSGEAKDSPGADASGAEKPVDPSRSSYSGIMNAHYRAAAAVLGIDKEELAGLVQKNGTVFTD